MNTAQIDLVRDTWARLWPMRDDVAALFYSKLFELAPHLQPLFRNAARDQNQRLMAMLDIVVRGLHHPDALAPALRDLGARHRRYGVSHVDYGTVAIALLWTLEQGLDSGFTADAHRAWMEAFALVTGLMRPA